MIASQKHLFDMPSDIAYFNNAYMSPLMHNVVAASAKGMAFKQQPWTYSSDQFFTYAEEARELAGQIMDGPADNIAIIPSVSYGIQIAANNLPIQKGQNIVVMENQFPSNVYPWQDKVKREGGEVVILPEPEDQDWTSVLLSAINSDTAIVAICQTHWSSGATIDLIKIRAALDVVGGYLVLDLTQSLGVQPFNVSDVRADFVVSATYKWMMGPYSLGFVYIDPKWHDGAPLEHNWINRRGSEDFAGLTNYRDEFQPGARRFDMGEKSNPAQLLGASAAMRQILDWGIDNIYESLSAKTESILRSLEPLGFKAAPESLRAGHYLGLSHESIDMSDLLKTLADQNIFVSARGRNLRITPHLYCDANDEQRLIAAITNFVSGAGNAKR